MRTVRDFMIFVKQEVGVKEPFEFCVLSKQHHKFWQKLSKIWRDKGISPFEVKDVDEATKLSDEEWQALEQEFRRLPCPQKC